MSPKFSKCWFVVLMLSLSAQAQDQPPVLYYSQITSSFDGLPPIGKRFQIKGRIDQSILAVEVESFGFEKKGEIPAAFTAPAGTNAFCDALTRARTRSDRVIHARVAWERARTENGHPASIFEVNHPRLYYGRHYAFFFKYYSAVDPNKQKEIARNALKGVFTSRTNFLDLVQRGLTGEMLQAALTQALARLPVNACPNALLDRKTKLPVDIDNLFTFEALQAIASEATTLYYAEEIRRLQRQVEEEGKVLDNIPQSATKDDTPAAATAANAAATTLKQAIAEAMAEKTDPQQKWEAAVRAVGPFDDFLREGEVKEKVEAVFTTLGLLAQRSSLQTDESIDEIVEQLVDKVEFRDVEEFLSATFVNPYLETMEERHPFIISLDGGLMYVRRFEEVVPTVAVNIKFNRIDFNDPLNTTPEVSFIAGLGMTAPDDLDPDYDGIFGGTGNRSLVLGLGARFPGISQLLRFQAGAVLYRQQDKNPLVDDSPVRASFYVGLSMNWNAVDFAAGLFSDRSNFSLGGN